MHTIDVSTNTVDTVDKKTNYLCEAIGWSGSVLVLAAYLIPMNPQLYVALNCVGATGIAAICFTKRAYQSVIVNSIWVVGGIIRYYTMKPA